MKLDLKSIFEFIKYCFKKLKSFLAIRNQPKHRKISFEKIIERKEKSIKKIFKFSYERRDFIQKTNNLPPPTKISNE